MSYRLLACDLDGTLMDDQLIISCRVRAALRAAQDRGVQVTLATGRSLASTRLYAQDLNIHLPLICYQGGLIADPLSGQVLRRISLARDLALEAVELAQARGWHLILYLGEGMYLQAFHHPREFYHDMLGTDLYQVDDLAAVLGQADLGEPSKFILVAERPQADCIQAELAAHFDGRLLVVRSHRLFVEGNPLAGNKGGALAWLADYLEVPQEQVMAIGDQGNDASMIAWAGLGVAMGSGSLEAKEAADWIAPPLSADGAAVAIERFLFSAPGFKMSGR